MYAVLLKHFWANFYVFCSNCVNMNVGGINYRTSDMIKFDKF